MTEDIDSKLGRLLRADRIAERDPLFRVRLLERGEQQRYRRQARTQWAILALLVAVPLLLWLAWPDRMMLSRLPVSQLLRDGLFAAFVLALVAAVVFSLRGILQAARWLRRGQRL